MLYMKDRARELYDFLDGFVHEEGLSLGSVIVSGWSFGSAWIVALLAYAEMFPVNYDLPLIRYIKRALLYGSSSLPAFNPRSFLTEHHHLQTHHTTHSVTRPLSIPGIPSPIRRFPL